MAAVEGSRKEEVEEIAAEGDLAPGGNAIGDGLFCWPAVERSGRSHFLMATGAGERAAGWTPFRWVSICLGRTETALASTCHHVSPKHARSNLASFAYRLDRRRQLDSVVGRLAWAAVHTIPHPYRVVTADA